MSKVLCCMLADLHLTLDVPVARAETDWLAVQKRYVDQVKAIANKHDCPIVVAGDLFDRWNPGPELLNWCLQNLFDCYAVWGQHDLRHHNAADIKKTGFWNLVLNGKVRPILPGESLNMGRLVLHGFPWGEKIVPHGMERKGKIHLAVCHRYVWMGKMVHMNAATEEGHASTVYDELRLGGYDAAVVGDNHKGFLTGTSPNIFVPGTFIRRKQDETNYKPHVGLLSDNGVIDRAFLDCSEDKFADVSKGAESLLSEGDVGSLVEELKGLGEGGLNFLDSLHRALSSLKVPKEVREILLKCAEGEK